LRPTPGRRLRSNLPREAEDLRSFCEAKVGAYDDTAALIEFS